MRLWLQFLDAKMIYVVEVLDMKFVKIGYSANEDVQQRIKQLQTGNPFQIKPIVSVDGTLLQEQTIHHELETAFGIVMIPVPPNEWYPGRMPLIRGFIEALRFGANQSIAYLQKWQPEFKRRSTRSGRDATTFETKFCWPVISERNNFFCLDNDHRPIRLRVQAEGVPAGADPK